MEDHVYTLPSKELSEKRHELAPGNDAAFHELGKQVFADGALPAKRKSALRRGCQRSSGTA